MEPDGVTEVVEGVRSLDLRALMVAFDERLLVLFELVLLVERALELGEVLELVELFLAVEVRGRL